MLMKAIHTRLFFFLSVILLSTATSDAQSFCDFITRVQTYQDSVRLICGDTHEFKFTAIDTASFNMQVYLGLFDKLIKSKDKVYGVANGYSWDAGKPVLYATDKNFDEQAYLKKRRQDQCHWLDSFLIAKTANIENDSAFEKKLERLRNFVESQKRCINDGLMLANFGRDSLNRACNNLVPEDSAEGYLQYLFFHEMGEQFALFWHSYYGEKMVLCSRDKVKYYRDIYRNTDYIHFDEGEMQKLVDQDLSPVVDLSPSFCKISWYELHPHSGIFECTYIVDRNFPYRVKKVSKEKVATVEQTILY